MKALHRYILNRFFYSIITIFVIIFFVFTVSRLAGDPVEAYVRPETPAEIVEIIREKYHLNDPIPVQFVYWLRGVAQGDLGRSQSYGMEPIVDILYRYLPLTFELNLYGLLLAVPISYWMGTMAAIKKDTLFDHFARLMAIIGSSLPRFFTGLLILAFLYPRGFVVVDPKFSFTRITGMPTIDALLNRDYEGLIEALKYLIGPLFTSFIGAFATNTRILRSSILEELNKEYILTGLSKGLSKEYVQKKYARRNALIPFTTMLGFWIASLFSGNAIMEVVFNRAGIGAIAASAAQVTDHNTVQAFTMIYAIMLVSCNFIVDIIYGFIDPRIKYGEEK
jgi:peptide/nickel transport system permease protein